MSGMRRRSLCSPGKPGIATNLPPPMVLHRYLPSCSVRISPCAGRAAKPVSTSARAARRMVFAKGRNITKLGRGSSLTPTSAAWPVAQVESTGNRKVQGDSLPGLKEAPSATARLSRVSAETSLYRRHRPQAFDEVVGQEHVVRTLKNAVERDRVHHAYLFVGSRGTGKTSLAKILARSLNCVNGPTVNPCGECESCRTIAAGTSLDVIEMDAASNRSVDDIRDLRERVGYAPA